jgi:uncharacterized protein (DUF1499 family)
VVPAAIAAAVVVIFGIGVATGFLGNVAAAERDFDAPPERLRDAVRAAAATMPRWTEIAATTSAAGPAVPLHYEARTRLAGFVDDVRLEVSMRNGGSHLRVRSSSREGAWDLGTNGRRVRAFLEALEAELGKK